MNEEQTRAPTALISGRDVFTLLLSDFSKSLIYQVALLVVVRTVTWKVFCCIAFGIRHQMVRVSNHLAHEVTFKLAMKLRKNSSPDECFVKAREHQNGDSFVNYCQD